MKRIKGTCLCGHVEYSLSDNLKYAGYCHCSQCRKMTGSPFSASGGVANSEFEITKGKDNLAQYSKGEESHTYFCKTCGSFIFGVVEKYKMSYFMLAPLDEAPSLAPQWHIYTNYKVSWYSINDDLPQHGEGL